MSEQAIKGFQDPTSGATEFNALTFLVRQLLSQINTATLVQVAKVTTAGGVSPAGTVDVQPLVNQQDGFGNSVPHGIVHGLPYMRIQGGANAIIMDPVVGDIGIAVFANRDISAVKSTKKQNNPGSARQFSMADGMYIGGILNGTPTVYIQLDGSNVKITATGAVNLTAPAINLQNSGSALQTLLNSTLLTWLNTHTHTGVTSGGGVTGAPVTTPPSSVATTITKAE